MYFTPMVGAAGNVSRYLRKLGTGAGGAVQRQLSQLTAAVYRTIIHVYSRTVGSAPVAMICCYAEM